MIGKRDLSQYLLERFVQLEPYMVCNRGVKVCRDPRCSFVCRHRWAAQQRAAIVQLFVDQEPPAIFAGNLTLHRLASVDEHRKARTAFMRCLRECCGKKEVALKIRCFTHAARKNSKGRSWHPGVRVADLIYGNVHYDFVAYSTTKVALPVVEKLLEKCWRLAWNGGPTEVKVDPVRSRRRTRLYGAMMLTLSPQLEDAIEQAVRYQAKDIQSVRSGKKKLWLLARNGIEAVWGSNGFWGDRTFRNLVKQYWDRRDAAPELNDRLIGWEVDEAEALKNIRWAGMDE